MPAAFPPTSKQLEALANAPSIYLYEWNAKLSAALLHDLSHLEVGLRNACDRQLAAAALPGDSHWTAQTRCLPCSRS